mmetsp:Transcript_17461/g.41460  ORF Transcript_17461/g.41460 Transcript_17461/m.41460 type:complete len:475 (+) Transcript_17461:55-1479(+)
MVRLLFALGLVAHIGALKTRIDKESCSPLKNMQSYSALTVGIGTPQQKFQLVADTGSSAVIVTHCSCQEANCYGYSTPCFSGTNRSSTFSVPLDSGGEPAAVAMEFGSGVIYGVIGTDKVTVGQTSALMNQSVIFMYDHQLDAGIYDFEGIFGLGLPYQHRGSEEGRSWLTTAAVESFSMCFSSLQEDGTLRLNTAAQSTLLGNVGEYHWGLDFHGISLGDSSAEALFCGDSETRSGMRSPCAVIPDSGTTLMLGPSDQIRTLYASLCDQWPRCRKAYAEFNRTQQDQSIGKAVGDWLKHVLDKWGLPSIETPLTPDPATQIKLDKRRQFESLLADCSSWAKGPAMLDEELPTLFWQVAGKEGKTQALRVPASAYVVAAAGPTGETMCLPFFGSYDYVTQSNGPVWILGTAIFYEYVVHYDLSTTPAGISFASTSCGSCDSSSEASVGLLRRRTQFRRQESKVRMPHINRDLPL